MAVQPRGHIVLQNDATFYRFELNILPTNEFNFRLMWQDTFVFCLYNLTRDDTVFETYDRIIYTVLYLLHFSYEFLAGICILFPFHIY
jgi:hypothetical protein